ncbi:sialate O-acetylesterase [Filimonas effusa]|uniref:Sialate O-acetylesterase n=1 Tax=Filimonas effusa TaxID=2508721 RepID=A0A4Q1D584_9BACT|nr:sialate O-acetylesterase [Filimonas effusa]RXK83116.1 sialate O-acetylesterase [Filimonas effusa]
MKKLTNPIPLPAASGETYNKGKTLSLVSIPAYLCLLLFSCLTFSAEGKIILPQLVRDSMILQRNQPLIIWGRADAGEKVTIRFNGQKLSARTGADGSWKVTMKPLPAGGPYTMQIDGSNHIVLKDILVGDVWLCAGQSNMVHQLQLHNEYFAADIKEANYPAIRQFWVPNVTNLQEPQRDLPSGSWKAANPQDVLQFSAVAYFFARTLYEKYKVPVGIINSSWGGTPIAAWTSEQGLQELPNWPSIIQQNKDTAYFYSRNRQAAAFEAANRHTPKSDKGLQGPVKWYDTNYVPKGWRNINVPGYWEDQGAVNLDGVVWYRKEIEVPPSMTGIPAKVYLGRIVDADELYVNGVRAGITYYQYPQRRYQLPENLLKAGKNILTVRVTNNAGKGGFVPDKPYALVAGDQSIDLKGYWQYKVGDIFTPTYPPVAGALVQNQPTALFNAMVAPLTNYAIKGVVWYQGESDISIANEYSRLLPALIADWRRQWQRPELPFVYAQLPDFMAVSYLPVESSLALLREAQLKTLSVPNTAMAVTMGLGEWNDIHPDNKKDVGIRLALAARKVAYQEDIVYSGPLFQSSQKEGNKIVLSFLHAGSGLVTSNDEAPGAFAIAGADKKFVWANAVIRNNKVEVWSEKIPQPMYVRYAWADSPDNANLCNKEGLPASPFRTDQ